TVERSTKLSVPDIDYFVVWTPASWITFAHFFVSLSMKAAKCSGLSPARIAPWLDSFSTTAGSFIASTAALFSAATMLGGVLAGATIPYQFSVRRFGMPASAVVGTSGALGTRCGAPT